MAGMASNGDAADPTPRIQYRPLVAAPELQQDWHDEQEDRNVTWPELFFDLFFVAAISNLGHLFKEQPDVANAGRIVMYHAIIFFLWADYATVRTRYRLQGLLFRFMGLVLQLGFLGFIIGVRDDMQWYHLLAGGYALTRLATAATYGIIATTIPRAREVALVHLTFDVLMIAAAVCAAVFHESYAVYFLIISGIAVAEAIDPLVPSLVFRHKDIPLHVEHMSERLGQLIMLHLGEAVIGFASSPLQNTIPQFTAVALAAVLVWCLHLYYYHIEPDQADHAYRQSRVRGLLFFYCHWPLAISFLLTGTGLRLMLGTYPGPHGDVSLSSTDPNSVTSGPSTAAAAAAAAVDRAPSSFWPGLWSPLGQSELEPIAPLDVSILLCVSYAASLHFLAIIRAAHYFSLDPEHRIVRHQERKGVKHWWNAWWAMLWLWPVPIYFIPLIMHLTTGHKSHTSYHDLSTYDALGFNSESRYLATTANSTLWDGLHGLHPNESSLGHDRGEKSGLSASMLLALLASHALVLTLAESLFAHRITKTPIANGLASHGDGDGGVLDDVSDTSDAAGDSPAEV